MNRAIGGYMPRKERNTDRILPEDNIPRCTGCGMRADVGMVPHFCKEIHFQAMPVLKTEAFRT